MDGRVSDLMEDVRVLLAGSYRKGSGGQYERLLQAECEAILEEAGEDLLAGLPDEAATLADLAFALASLDEHLSSLPSRSLAN